MNMRIFKVEVFSLSLLNLICNTKVIEAGLEEKAWEHLC